MNLNQNKRRGVKQLDLGGNVIATFDSLREAAKQTGTNIASLCMCCRGKQKLANGYRWEYDNSNLKLPSDPLDKLLDFL